MMKRWLLKHSKKLMSMTSAMAMAYAYTYLGRICATFFYQPKVPQALLDMDNE